MLINRRQLFEAVQRGAASVEDMRTLGVDSVVAAKSDPDTVQHRSGVVRAPTKIGKRRHRFTVSDDAPDRMGDVIDVKGWEVKNFLKNPVMLWAHDDSSPPLGLWSNLDKAIGDRSRLDAESRFTDVGINPFADMISDMVDRRVVRATSVGFLPIESVKPEDPGERSKLGLGEFGVFYKSAELLEISLVPIPANPRALGRRLKALQQECGYDPSLLAAFMETCPVGQAALLSMSTARHFTSPGLERRAMDDEEKQEDEPIEDEPEEEETMEDRMDKLAMLVGDLIERVEALEGGDDEESDEADESAVDDDEVQPTKSQKDSNSSSTKGRNKDAGDFFERVLSEVDKQLAE